MSDSIETLTTLRPRSPLNEKSEKVGNTSLVEHTQLAIVSLAIPLSDDESVETALQSIMKVSRPAVGQLTHAKGDSPGFSNLLALGLQADQLFLVFDYPETTPVEQVSKSIGEIAYLTDQSDSWVVIDINGPLATTALERICPLDLHDSVMNDTVVARTVMEHLSVILYRQADGYRLLSPRSSAESFWHALHTSLVNVSD